jgi:hypothetical protein
VFIKAPSKDKLTIKLLTQSVAYKSVQAKLQAFGRPVLLEKPVGNYSTKSPSYVGPQHQERGTNMQAPRSAMDRGIDVIGRCPFNSGRNSR